MCCRQWNNIKWSSSKKWRTPRSVLGPLLFLIHISNINFADDTRILLGIKDEEDTQMLQNNLHKLYKWADTNNMKFNANKFELLRYGKEQEIKSATTYKSYMMIQTTPMTWNTVRYSVSNKQKFSTILSRKCNNCIWASFVQLVSKISERHWKC